MYLFSGVGLPRDFTKTMEQKRTIKSHTRDRYLTKEEAEKYRSIRGAVEKEKPAILEMYKKLKRLGFPKKK